ncbi:hypothetical protein [Geoalkalibacter halelectricus]|uniref:hypothetical protein n=1 Tax=Geoalkalibacter halelectricus TaxID=2847045 RepID=UPI00266E90B9|nr:hypothetical protein [Geoalkalibacter halelectricus]MDO3380434.1 hypothetical protein [Geoalkalibacter halelectricus]
MSVRYSKNGKWKLYWGAMPLPRGAEALGTVSTDDGAGALLRLANGYYVQGNAGAIKVLDQGAVDRALEVSEAAAGMGRVTSEKRAAASRRNGLKGGRPRKMGQ